MRRLIPSALMLAACSSSATAATRNFSLAPFDKVQVTGPFTVNVRTGPGPSARATGNGKALDRLIVEVRGGTLVVSAMNRDWKAWTSWGGEDLGKVMVSITTPSLRAAALTGSGALMIDRAKAPRFDLSLTGSGDVAIGAIDAERVDATVTGSGDARIAGRTRQIRVLLQGSGDVDAANLTAADAEVNVAGTGDAALNASRTARISLMGSGDVTVTGNARCTVSKRGSGNVTCGR